jgi:hypothetical protein
VTEPRNNGRAVAVAVIVAVAIASAFGGAAIDRAYVHRATRLVGDTTFHPISSMLRSPSEADRLRYRTELSEALALSADQNRVVDSILTHRAGQFDGLRTSIRPQVERLLDEVRHDIETVLTAEQRTAYRKLRGDTTTGRTP